MTITEGGCDGFHIIVIEYGIEGQYFISLFIYYIDRVEALSSKFHNWDLKRGFGLKLWFPSNVVTV